jgi:hypothetical protein
LVATYAPAGAGTVRPQIYWRLFRPEHIEGMGLDLIVSVQTDLLDSDPSMSTASILPVEGLLRLHGPGADQFEPLVIDDPAPLDAGLLLFRLAGGRLSYVEMVHPSDFCRAGVRTEDAARHTARLSFPLFPGRLEKGVIRRARLRGCFLPREDDRSVAAALYGEFAASTPPLTA